MVWAMIYYLNYPFLKNWTEDLGIVPASMDNAKKLLKNGEVLGVAPGGMREALRAVVKDIN